MEPVSKRLQVRQHFGVDQHRRGERHTPVHDAMTGGDDTVFAEWAAAAPGEKKLDGALMTELGTRWPFLFADNGTGIAHLEARLS